MRVPTLRRVATAVARRSTNLVATAIANADARADFHGFADEQAALRRVATLVARAVPPEQVFAAVTEEVGRVLQADLTVMIRYEPNGMAANVGRWNRTDIPTLHLTAPIGGHNVTTLVFETGRPARLDDYGDASGPSAEFARADRLHSAVGVPIRVAGRLWGVMMVGCRRAEPLPADTETRLAAFTELVATAIGNAQGRLELGCRVKEQAALRRVAELVARAAPPEEVFAAVTAEVGRWLDADSTAMSRYDSDDVATVLRAWAEGGAGPPVCGGTQVRLAGRNVITLVHETRRPARIDEDRGRAGRAASLVRRRGIRSVVGVPITVRGRLWGVITVLATHHDPLPPEIEERLAGFTELVAIAIGNAQARGELRAFADEQAALRRVATLVAEAAPPEAVFAAVTAEVGRALDEEAVSMYRYDGDGAATVVGLWGRLGVPIGTRVRLGGRNVLTLVAQTGRAARIDHYGTAASGAPAELACALGVRSLVGVPINVEGRLWGVATMASARGDSLPPETEERLAGFTELLATAIANAQARVELRNFADEQAALRRVATLVAGGAAPTEVFGAVAEEVGRLFAAAQTVMLRYDADAQATVVGYQSAIGGGAVLTVGDRYPLGGRNATTLVFETGAPTRIDDYCKATGTLGRIARAVGCQSCVAVPINVEGSLWGVIGVVANQQPSLPPETEVRLARFTELLATAIANAQARVEVRGFAEEQAGLRRVATLVARAAAPGQVFAAVAAEAGGLLGCDFTLLNRYDPDGLVTVVGAWSAAGGPLPLPVGTRVGIEGQNASMRVRVTGKPVRMDRYGADIGDGPSAFVAAGMRTSVGAPITVDGRLWGVMIAISRADCLPPDTEARLAGFTELAATAVANAEAQAALTASRARIVATADATRRRIERDLHDGAQQRLVSIALQLRKLREAVPPEAGELVPQLDDVAGRFGEVIDEVREIARGIHPAALAHGGLRRALKTVARRSAIPVDLHVGIEDRLPDAIELAAYYIAAEALTNIAKHADASMAHLDVTCRAGVLNVLVRDDGRGGADLTSGTGLVGLSDRVEALGGRLVVDSSPGRGTTVEAFLPFDAPNNRPVTPETTLRPSG